MRTKRVDGVPTKKISIFAAAALVASMFIVGSVEANVATSPDTPSNGGEPDGYVVSQLPHSTVYEPAPGIIAGNPSAEAFDIVGADGRHHRQVLLQWQSHQDVPGADAEMLLAQSYDNGFTFPSAKDPLKNGGGPVARLRDGTLIAIGFIPAKVVNDHTLELYRKVSKDNGKSWKDELATFTTDHTFNAKLFNRGIRTHPGIVVAKDAALLMSYYTAYSQDPFWRAEVARSTDGGKTWARWGTIAAPGPNGYYYNETAIARAVNGDLVAVSRTSTDKSGLAELRTSRSSDDGKTWTTPATLKITTATGEPGPTTGILPALRLLPNGIMTLRFGRPDNWIAISPDGLGNSFEQAQTTYVNHPKVISSFQRFHGSSGNGWTAVVASNRLLVTGDNCAPTWGCPETDTGFHTDGEYRVWKKFVDIVGPGVGKIDLLGKHARGKVKLDTNMTAHDPKLPEMSPVGAIDGSTDWASSAVLRPDDDGPATYTLTLDQTYTLTRAGLSLHPGKPAAATVEVSTDGTTWTKVLETGEITSYALRYFPINGQPARQVRITVDDQNADKAGAAFLNEVELYSTVDSFENDPVGQAPRGYTDCVGASVTDFDVNDSRHALRLADAWNDRIARATKVTAPAPKQNLQFQVNSIGYPRAFMFITRGDTAVQKGVKAYQISLFSDGSIAYYDATARKWNRLTEPGVAPQRTWHKIRVEATLAGAEVFLNGKSVGTAPPTTPGVIALAGHQFASSGTGSAYDHFIIDDVEQTYPL